MKQEVIEKLESFSFHLANLLNTNCRVVDTHAQCFLTEAIGNARYFSPFCHNRECNLLHTYLYGCNEAYRWGGKYIFYCAEGFVFIASSVSDENGELSGGLVLGPIIMGELDDTLQLYQNPDIRENVLELANISTDRVNHIAEIMAGITEGVSGVAHSLMGSVVFKQEQVLQNLYDSGPRTDSDAYPIETEKKLKMILQSSDKKGAQALLNELLGSIYVMARFDVELIKIRMIELLSVLSRATMDAGADPNEIIWFNTGCIREMQKCASIEEVSVWITGVLQQFIHYSFDFSSVKHSDTVYKVMDYIRTNYYNKISLDDIAQYVNFSKAYLSRIFKEETGENISAYINRVRIEKAKLLLSDQRCSLVDVANLTGFEDQSYFTKVFKSVAGISPRKFKESRTK